MLPLFVSHWNLAAEVGSLACDAPTPSSWEMSQAEALPWAEETPSTGEEDQVDALEPAMQMPCVSCTVFPLTCANLEFSGVLCPVGYMMVVNPSMPPSNGGQAFQMEQMATNGWDVCQWCRYQWWCCCCPCQRCGFQWASCQCPGHAMLGSTWSTGLNDTMDSSTWLRQTSVSPTVCKAATYYLQQNTYLLDNCLIIYSIYTNT